MKLGLEEICVAGSSRHWALLPVSLTYKLSVDEVAMNQHAKHVDTVDSRSFCPEATVRTYQQTNIPDR